MNNLQSRTLFQDEILPIWQPQLLDTSLGGVDQNANEYGLGDLGGVGL